MFNFAVKSSEVRDNFSEFIDEVVHKSPKIVNRRRDHFLAINLQHLQTLVENLVLNVYFDQDEEGHFISSFREIPDLLGYGATKEESLEKLINDFIEYSHDYIGDSFHLYIHAPNRKGHFPFILKVMMQNSPLEIKQWIHVEH